MASSCLGDCTLLQLKFLSLFVHSKRAILPSVPPKTNTGGQRSSFFCICVMTLIRCDFDDVKREHHQHGARRHVRARENLLIAARPPRHTKNAPMTNISSIVPCQRVVVHTLIME
jgi:hypothetical protein